jgi:2-methylcitrate dehydratase PrpD
VLDLKSRITLVGDADLTLARPEGQSHVSVTTKDGTRLEQRVTTFKGKADNPLTSVEISEKARELMTPVLGGQRAVELIDTLSRLEELDSVRDLRPLLSA